MIPKTGVAPEDILTAAQETCDMTYRIDPEHGIIRGKISGMEAARQAVYLILNTQRYQHEIYSRNFGVDLAGLFGMPHDYVMSELKRRISEALLRDSRITGVENFTFKSSGSEMTVSFTVRTKYGDIDTAKTVTGLV